MNFTHVGIGIDTARYGHHVSFLDQEKRTAAKPFHFKEDAQGYQQLRAALDSLRGKSGNVFLHIRLDAAGKYADNLLHWLYGLKLDNVSISVGKPEANKAYREAHFDKRKADQIESLGFIARWASQENGNDQRNRYPNCMCSGCQNRFYRALQFSQSADRLLWLLLRADR